MCFSPINGVVTNISSNALTLSSHIRFSRLKEIKLPISRPRILFHMCKSGQFTSRSPYLYIDYQQSMNKEVIKAFKPINYQCSKTSNQCCNL